MSVHYSTGNKNAASPLALVSSLFRNDGKTDNMVAVTEIKLQYTYVTVTFSLQRCRIVFLITWIQRCTKYVTITFNSKLISNVGDVRFKQRYKLNVAKCKLQRLSNEIFKYVINTFQIQRCLIVFLITFIQCSTKNLTLTFKS